MKDVTPASAYVAIIPLLTEAARKAGYALAVHGSLGRDLDLVAVPWTNEAITAGMLILRLHRAIRCERAPEGPDEKPHGRVAYRLQCGGGLYLDVSVMPRKPA